jgi:hypothetical protein
VTDEEEDSDVGVVKALFSSTYRILIPLLHSVVAVFVDVVIR